MNDHITAAALVRRVREPPDVAQTDSKTHAGKQKLQPTSPQLAVPAAAAPRNPDVLKVGFTIRLLAQAGCTGQRFARSSEKQTRIEVEFNFAFPKFTHGMRKSYVMNAGTFMFYVNSVWDLLVLLGFLMSTGHCPANNEFQAFPGTKL